MGRLQHSRTILWRYKRQHSSQVLTSFVVLFPLLIMFLAYVYAPADGSASADRHLLSCRPNTTHGDAHAFPHEIFTEEQKKNGAILLYLFGAIVCFAGLFFTCGDYFEPSLEEISERLGLTEDVAGATFMAAGSSAPELFTSIVGLFFAESDVGVGTIVGSAIFNLLTIIGAVGLFLAYKSTPENPRDVGLDWYVVTRDITFYSASIMLLVWSIYDQAVQWYEALILLLLYVGYIVWMKFNQRIGKWAKLQYQNYIDSTNPKKATAAGWQASNCQVMVKKVVDSMAFDVGIYIIILFNMGLVAVDLIGGEDAQQDWMGVANAICSVVYVLEMLVKMYAYQFVGYFLETMNVFDAFLVFMILLEFVMSGSGAAGAGRGLRLFKVVRAVRSARIFRLAHGLPHDHDHPSRDQPPLVKEAGNGNPRRVSIQVEPVPDEERILSPTVYSKFDAPWKEGDTPRKGEGKEPSPSLSAQREGSVSPQRIKLRSSASVSSKVMPLPEDPVSPEDPKDSKQVDGQSAPDQEALLQKPEEEDDDDDEAPLYPFEIPKDIATAEMVWWVCTWPITALLFFTIPPCNQEGWKAHKWLIISFSMSIVWIGFYTYLMVWMATVLGKTLNIPDPVMGLTFLAAGTSLPDLMASIGVALKGQLDGAVANANGSNVFDICIGLAGPWLVATWTITDEVPILSDALFITVFTLFLFVGIVIIALKYAEWKLSVRVSWLFMFLYALFVAQSLLMEYGIICL